MKVGRRGHPQALKQQAIAKLSSGKYTLRALSAELNVSVPTLLKWRDSAPAPASKPAAAAPAPTDAQAEIARLRREIEELQAERDRLRKGILALAGLTE